MKKNISLILVFTFICNAVNAQTDFKKHNFSGGFSLDFNSFRSMEHQAGDYSVEYYDTENPRVGGGLEYWLRFNQKHGISAGFTVNYMGITAKMGYINDSLGQLSVLTGITGNSLQFPIYYRQVLEGRNSFKAEFFTGPVLCFQSASSRKSYNGNYDWIKPYNPEFERFMIASAENVVPTFRLRGTLGAALHFKGFRLSAYRTVSLQDNLDVLQWNYRSYFINRRLNTWSIGLSYIVSLP